MKAGDRIRVTDDYVVSNDADNLQGQCGVITDIIVHEFWPFRVQLDMDAEGCTGLYAAGEIELEDGTKDEPKENTVTVTQVQLKAWVEENFSHDPLDLGQALATFFEKRDPESPVGPDDLVCDGEPDDDISCGHSWGAHDDYGCLDYSCACGLPGERK